MHDIPGIEFIPFDKKAGIKGYLDLRRRLTSRRFDVLLDMQMSLRASLIALMIKSPIKLGFDKIRAKDYQWLFTNHKIQYQPQQHVIDSFFGFTEALGISEHRYDWDIPVPKFNPTEFGLNDDDHFLVISPCSSMAYRNWSATGYAEVADYVQDRYNVKIVLCGGPSDIEADYAVKIKQLCKHPVIDLIGKTSLKQLMSVLNSAIAVIAPDAGPAHLANAVGTPVIGLYATTNPDRARPYNYPDLVVNKYPEAVQAKFGKSVADVPWGARVRDEGTMDRIKPSDVIAIIDKCLADTEHFNQL